MARPRVRLRGFEVRAQRVSGVQVKSGRRNVVKGMDVHDVGELGQNASQGIEITRGSHNRVIGNEIHSIGPGFESRGIWMLQTREGLVKGNVVYLVRKDGIRDWQSLDDRIISNQFFLNLQRDQLQPDDGRVRGQQLRRAQPGRVRGQARVVRARG